MDSRSSVARALASAMLSASLSKPGLVNRGATVLGRGPAWLRFLVARILGHFGAGTRPSQFRLERFILQDTGFLKAYEKQPIQIRSQRPRAPSMRPAAGPPRAWQLPSICTTGNLGRLLNLLPNELAWFADCRSLEEKLPAGPLRHYHYRWQLKHDGSARLIEGPKQRLKAIQRYLLREILDRIPPHEAAHGFRSKRFIRTFVEPHVRRAMVIKLDLKDFFPGILRARVLAIFLTAGHPEKVAQMLTGLCTNSTPPGVIKTCPGTCSSQQIRRAKLLYRRPHLPQGAPTSPALANLAAYRLDCRLAGLARAALVTRATPMTSFSREIGILDGWSAGSTFASALSHWKKGSKCIRAKRE
jgi:RNA-directed DNA polymerase